MGVKRKLKVNEYGVFRGRKMIAGRTEEEIYKLFDMPFIEPELREDRGELQAAVKGRLPRLIQLGDIKGDLHSHTKETDGHYTAVEMAEAAKKLGYEYLAVSDHSKRVTMAHGLDAKRLAKAVKDIDKLNARLKGITLLKSIECDILVDGSLDLPDDILRELDLVLCSIHYNFNLSKEKQTERVLRVLDNRLVNIFCHPSGRLINERPAYEIDLEKVMKAAVARGCYLELNGHPDRLQPRRRPLSDGQRDGSEDRHFNRRPQPGRPGPDEVRDRSGAARLARAGRCHQHAEPGGAAQAPQEDVGGSSSHEPVAHVAPSSVSIWKVEWRTLKREEMASWARRSTPFVSHPDRTFRWALSETNPEVMVQT